MTQKPRAITLKPVRPISDASVSSVAFSVFLTRVLVTDWILAVISFTESAASFIFEPNIVSTSFAILPALSGTMCSRINPLFVKSVKAAISS